mmetsp:Transcript_29660/g.63034  ORF Transcript_29660/g.63034 Transcript_29660/m.63034 type:complete len:237 (+) Transcript_29660:111-821(+)
MEAQYAEAGALALNVAPFGSVRGGASKVVGSTCSDECSASDCGTPAAEQLGPAAPVIWLCSSRFVSSSRFFRSACLRREANQTPNSFCMRALFWLSSFCISSTSPFTVFSSPVRSRKSVRRRSKTCIRASSSGPSSTEAPSSKPAAVMARSVRLLSSSFLASLMESRIVFACSPRVFAKLMCSFKSVFFSSNQAGGLYTVVRKTSRAASWSNNSFAASAPEGADKVCGLKGRTPAC